MKRWLRRIPLPLILGVVTTVGVAWEFAYKDTGRTFGEPWVRGERNHEGGVWLVRIGDRVGATQVQSHWVPGISFNQSPHPAPDTVLPQWCSRAAIESLDARTGLAQHTDYFTVCGWPANALWLHAQWNGVAWDIYGGFRVGMVLSGEMTPIGATRALPVTPVWPGFLINTLFYAALWFGVFFIIGTVKRGLRRRRGACVNCGYDPRGNAPGQTGCPECGWGRVAEGAA